MFLREGVLDVCAFAYPLQLVICVVDGLVIGDKRFGPIDTFDHLLVFPHDLLAANQSQLMVLQLARCYDV